MNLRTRDNFKDHFSRQSALYAAFRPGYPDALFSCLAGLCPAHELAWDCGTGNGQAALSLAAHFHKVFASDPSEQQIKNAFLHDKITYHIERAEDTSLPDASVDLIVAANSLHWFTRESFYLEADRVLKQQGLLVAWAYALPAVSPAIDKMTAYLHYQTLEDYWLPENKLVLDGYKSFDFPFEAIELPPFYSEKELDLKEFIGYLNTWSAVQRFIAKNKFNPTGDLQKALSAVWKDPFEKKSVKWELMFRAGRKVQAK